VKLALNALALQLIQMSPADEPPEAGAPEPGGRPEPPRSTRPDRGRQRSGAPETPAALSWQARPGWRGRALAAWIQFDVVDLPWLQMAYEGRRRDGLTCVKLSRSRHVLRVRRPERFGARDPRGVYVKRYLINTPRRRLGNLLSGGKARREFRLGWRLIQRGLRTARPLAYVIADPMRILDRQAPPGFARAASFLVTEEVLNDGTIYEWACRGDAAGCEGFYPALARYIAAMHQRGFYHDDLSGKNICVASGEELRAWLAADRGAATAAANGLLSKFILFDVDHGRLFREGKVPFRLRMRNVFQILRSLRHFDMKTRAARRQFVEDYLEAAGLSTARRRRAAEKSINRFARARLGHELV